MKEKYQMMEKLKDKIERIVLIIAILLMTVSWVVMCERSKTPQNVTKIDTVTVTDTMWKHDTLKIDKPIPKIIKILKRDTLYSKEGDTLELVTETKKYQDTVIHELDTAIINTQVTGINPQLDNVSVMFNRREITNTIEITKYIEKRKRFNLGIGVGYGYGLKNKGIEPFVGFSFVYNL